MRTARTTNGVKLARYYVGPLAFVVAGITFWSRRRERTAASRQISGGQPQSVQQGAQAQDLRLADSRLTSVAGIVMQTGFGTMLGGLALAVALTHIAVAYRVEAAIFGGYTGVVGAVAGLGLLDVAEVDDFVEIKREIVTDAVMSLLLSYFVALIFAGLIASGSLS